MACLYANPIVLHTAPPAEDKMPLFSLKSPEKAVKKLFSDLFLSIFNIENEESIILYKALIYNVMMCVC